MRVLEMSKRSHERESVPRVSDPPVDDDDELARVLEASRLEAMNAAPLTRASTVDDIEKAIQ